MKTLKFDLVMCLINCRSDTKDYLEEMLSRNVYENTLIESQIIARNSIMTETYKIKSKIQFSDIQAKP